MITSSPAFARNNGFTPQDRGGKRMRNVTLGITPSIGVEEMAMFCLPLSDNENAPNLWDYTPTKRERVIPRQPLVDTPQARERRIAKYTAMVAAGQELFPHKEGDAFMADDTPPRKGRVPIMRTPSGWRTLGSVSED